MTRRAVPGFEGIYEVSDGGRVWSLDRMQTMKNGHRRTVKGRELKPALTGGGYPHVSLWRDGRQAWFTAVHRIVALAFIGPRPEGMEVRHLDGNPENNALANLTYGTPSENQFDKVRHGTHQNARKNQCAQGHPYDERNTILDKNGWRSCRTCVSTWAARRYQRNKAMAEVTP